MRGELVESNTRLFKIGCPEKKRNKESQHDAKKNLNLKIARKIVRVRGFRWGKRQIRQLRQPEALPNNRSMRKKRKHHNERKRKTNTPGTRNHGKGEGAKKAPPCGVRVSSMDGLCGRHDLAGDRAVKGIEKSSLRKKKVKKRKRGRNFLF